MPLIALEDDEEPVKPGSNLIPLEEDGFFDPAKKAFKEAYKGIEDTATGAKSAAAQVTGATYGLTYGAVPAVVGAFEGAINAGKAGISNLWEKAKKGETLSVKEWDQIKADWKDFSKAWEEGAKKRPVSEEIGKQLKSQVIGPSAEMYKAPMEAGEGLAGSPFAAGFEMIGEHGGPIAKSAAEVALAAMGARAALRPKVPKPAKDTAGLGEAEKLKEDFPPYVDDTPPEVVEAREQLKAWETRANKAADRATKEQGGLIPLEEDLYTADPQGQLPFASRAGEAEAAIDSQRPVNTLGPLDLDENGIPINKSRTEDVSLEENPQKGLFDREVDKQLIPSHEEIATRRYDALLSDLIREHRRDPTDPGFSLGMKDLLDERDVENNPPAVQRGERGPSMDSAVPESPPLNTRPISGKTQMGRQRGAIDFNVNATAFPRWTKKWNDYIAHLDKYLPKGSFARNSDDTPLVLWHGTKDKKFPRSELKSPYEAGPHFTSIPDPALMFARGHGEMKDAYWDAINNGREPTPSTKKGALPNGKLAEGHYIFDTYKEKVKTPHPFETHEEALAIVDQLNNQAGAPRYDVFANIPREELINTGRLIPMLLKKHAKILETYSDIGNWEARNVIFQIARGTLEVADPKVLARAEKVMEDINKHREATQRIPDDAYYNEKLKEVMGEYNVIKYPNQMELIKEPSLIPGHSVNDKFPPSYMVLDTTLLADPRYALKASIKHGPNKLEGAKELGITPAIHMEKAKKLGGTGHKEGGALDLSAFFSPRAKKVAQKEAKLSKLVYSTDNRTTAEFVKDTPLPTTDITYQVQSQTASWRTTNPLLRNLGTAKETGYRVYHYMNDKLRQANSLEHSLNKGLLPSYNNLYKHYKMKGSGVVNRLGGGVKTFWDGAAWKAFKDDLAIVLDMEGGKGWFDPNLKNYVPSVKNLTDRGMSPESAAVWHDIHKANAALWDRLTTIAKINGRPIPDELRVPGWMPHVWKGPYAVEILNMAKKAGAPGEFVGEFNFHTRKERDIAVKAINDSIAKHGFEYQVDIKEPRAVNDAAGLMDELYKAQKIMENNPGMNTLVRIVRESQAKGMITHAMERHGGKKKGHLLERALLDNDDPLGLSKKEMYDAMQLPQRAAEAINGWYVRGLFMNDYLFPLQQLGYFDKPNLGKAVHDIVNNFIDVPDHLFKNMEAAARSYLINAGVNPGLANKFVRQTHGGVAKFLLLGNLRYYVINSFQNSYLPFYLWSAATKMKNWGEFAPSMTKTFIDMLGNIPEILAMKENASELMKYAVDKGYIEPVFVEHIDPTSFKDPISSAIERRTRYMSFVMGYHFYKQIPGFSKLDALEAAGKAADGVGVPYNPQFGQPIALKNMAGELGKPLSMFSTFPVHMMGLMSHLTSNSAKLPIGKVYDAAKLVGGFAAFQALLWGMGGAPFVNNINDMFEKLNRNYGMNLPTMKEWVRSWDLDKKIGEGAAETSEVGIISSLLRYDMSASAQGPGLFNPLTLSLDLFALVGATGTLLGNWATQGPPTKAQLWTWARHIPRSDIRGVAEYLIKHQGGDIARKALLGEENDSKDYAPLKDINDRSDYLRSRMDTVMNMLGIKSVGETKSLTSETIEAKKIKMDKERVDYLLQSVRESVDTDPDRSKQYIVKLVQEYLKDPGLVSNAIAKFRIERNLTENQKRAINIDSIESVKNYVRRQQIKEREPHDLY